MPPKKSMSTAAPRGRPAGSKNKAAASSSSSPRTTGANKPGAASAKKKTPTGTGKGEQRAASGSESRAPEAADDPVEVDDDDDEVEVDEEDDDDDEPAKTIPPDLLSRVLHEFFEKDGTRITKAANSAVAKYMDVFVREAIARAAAERGSGTFLEVEDLEKIAPQLLLDL